MFNGFLELDSDADSPDESDNENENSTKPEVRQVTFFAYEFLFYSRQVKFRLLHLHLVQPIYVIAVIVVVKSV